MHGVVDQQAPVDDIRVGIVIGDGTDSIAESASAPLLEPEQNPPGMPPVPVPIMLALAYSWPCIRVGQFANSAHFPLVNLGIFTPSENGPRIQ